MLKNKTQLQRLIFIDRSIREGMAHGKLSNCKTIAAAYEVSSKSIMRDIDYLKNQCAAPIRYDPKQHGYYFTEENYQLPAINISESDLFAIYIARKALDDQHKNTPVYQKLVAVFNKIEESLPERISISPAWVDNRISVFSGFQTDIDPLTWDTVAAGLQNFQTLQISYRKPGSKKRSTRKVDPYHAISFQGEWYLLAFCHLRKEVRIFAVSRIAQATKQNCKFSIPADFDFTRFTDSYFGIYRDARQHKVQINFAAKHAPYVLEREWHRNQTVKKHRDGSLTLSFTTNQLFAVKRWILSWGSGVEVITPARLRADIHRELEKVLQAYA